MNIAEKSKETFIYLVVHESRKAVDEMEIRYKVYVVDTWEAADKIAKGLLVDNVVMANLYKKTHIIVTVWSVGYMLDMRAYQLHESYKLYIGG